MMRWAQVDQSFRGQPTASADSRVRPSRPGADREGNDSPSANRIERHDHYSLPNRDASITAADQEIRRGCTVLDSVSTTALPIAKGSLRLNDGADRSSGCDRVGMAVRDLPGVSLASEDHGYPQRERGHVVLSGNRASVRSI